MTTQFFSSGESKREREREGAKYKNGQKRPSGAYYAAFSVSFRECVSVDGLVLTLGSAGELLVLLLPVLLVDFLIQHIETLHEVGERRRERVTSRIWTMAPTRWHSVAKAHLFFSFRFFSLFFCFLVCLSFWFLALSCIVSTLNPQSRGQRTDADRRHRRRIHQASSVDELLADVDRVESSQVGYFAGKTPRVFFCLLCCCFCFAVLFGHPSQRDGNIWKLNGEG